MKMNDSITSAKSFIEDSIWDQGLTMEDIRLEYPAVLSFKYLWNGVKGRDGLKGFSHQVLKDGYICNNTLFVESRISSPAMAIQAETLNALGIKKIIYIGIAGAISPDLKIGDVVVSTGAVNETGTGMCYGYDFGSMIPSDLNLSRRLHDQLKAHGLDPYLSVHWCTDAPYKETAVKVKGFRDKGANCVEMEGAGLFAVAREYGIPAAAVFVISDELRETGWVQGWADPRFKKAITSLADFAVAISKEL